MPTSVDNQDKVTSNQFIPTSRNTPRPSTAKESTTTPFVRIPFGPFSLNDNPNENSESEESLIDTDKTIISLSCDVRHIFHEECIMAIINRRNSLNVCPLCREPIY